MRKNFLYSLGSTALKALGRLRWCVLRAVEVLYIHVILRFA